MPDIQISRGFIDVYLRGDLAQQLEKQRHLANQVAAQMGSVLQNAQKLGAAGGGQITTPEQQRALTRMVELSRTMLVTQTSLGVAAATITAQMVRSGDAGAKSTEGQVRAAKILADTLKDAAGAQRQVGGSVAQAADPVQRQAKAATELKDSLVGAATQQAAVVRQARELDDVEKAILQRSRETYKSQKEEMETAQKTANLLREGIPVPGQQHRGRGKEEEKYGEGAQRDPNLFMGAARKYYQGLGREYETTRALAEADRIRTSLQGLKLGTAEHETAYHETQRAQRDRIMFGFNRRESERGFDLKTLGGAEGRANFRDELLKSFSDQAGESSLALRRALIERQTAIGSPEHRLAAQQGFAQNLAEGTNAHMRSQVESESRNALLGTQYGQELYRQQLQAAQLALASQAAELNKASQIESELVGSSADLAKVREDVARVLREEYDAERRAANAASERARQLATPEGQRRLQETAAERQSLRLSQLSVGLSEGSANLAHMRSPAGRLLQQQELFMGGNRGLQDLAGQVEGARSKSQFLGSDEGQGQLRERVRLQKELAAINKSMDYARLAGEQGRFNAVLSVTDDKLKAVQKSLEPLGSIATRTFAVGTAAILGFAKVGSPVIFENMTLAIRDTSAVIGMAFAPVVSELTKKIQALGDWFLNLDEGVRSQIVHWVTWGTAMSGVAMILPRIIGGIQMATGAFRALALAMGPIGAVAALLGGAALVARLGGNSPEAKDRRHDLATAFAPVVNSMGKILKALEPVIVKFADVFADVAVHFAQAVAQFAEAVLPLAQVLGDVVGFLNKPGIFGRIDPGLEKNVRGALFGKPIRDLIFGGDEEEGGKIRRRSSVGAGGRDAQIMALDQVWKSIQIEAIRAPGVQEAILKENERIAALNGDMAKALDQIVNLLGAGGNLFQPPALRR